MEALTELMRTVLNINFIQAVISKPRSKDGYIKVRVRPVDRKGSLYFQFEALTATQAFHENLPGREALSRILEYMQDFGQMQVLTREMNYTVLVSKKGRITIHKKQTEGDVKAASLSHDRSKKYILQEGIPVPFLEELGVMTCEGRIVKSRFDKFRQINRFLEFIEDILPQLDRGRRLTILDFGCGKSYLTFAMYYYLHELKQYDIHIIGLDLKQDVISHCSGLASKYGYDNLHFLTGDIAHYESAGEVDMVVSLHACDTATDYALAKAVEWNAKVILSVPCCQHELNGQIRNKELAPVLEYGILKERFAALVTDALRAKYLEAAGYDTQVLEFIDMEHTPKNILLRAVKNVKNVRGGQKALDQIKQCEELLLVKPLLGRLLQEIEGTDA